MLERKQTNPPLITIRNAEGEGTALMRVIDTVDRADMDARDTKLVFDKSETRVQLSQVWFAGQDGFEVCGTMDSCEKD